MTPTGLAFAAFLAGVLGLYWLGPRRRDWQNLVLLSASYVFYLSWSPQWLPLLVGATLVDFGAARALDAGAREPRLRRMIVAVSVSVNVGTLFWFKYRGFFAESLGALLETVGVPADPATLRIALPIGLSYFTLIKIGYVLDVYHRRVAAERSLVTFATFVCFFPQIVAGPITRAGQMLPQLAAARRVSYEVLARAGSALLVGWWMKGYLADWMAPTVVDPVFASAGEAGAMSHWLALLGYAVQLFCDFAGYTLLAIGTARLFAIELPPNFDRPYISRSMPEFWRRWHISLNTWLFDYVYGPLTTGRGPLHGMVATNLVLVFALSGLWHGARWTFVIWGLLQGIALAVHHRWDAWYRARCREDRRWVEARRSTAYALAAWGTTLAWFLVTLVLFRAPDLSSAAAFLGGLGGSGQGSPITLDKVALLNLIVAFGFVALHHGAGLPRGTRVRARLAALPAPVLGVLAGLVIGWLLLFAPLARGTFIYAQF